MTSQKDIIKYSKIADSYRFNKILYDGSNAAITINLTHHDLLM